MNKPIDTNQANEDALTYGVDLGIPGGDFIALSIKKGSTLFTFTGDEAVAIIDLIRTEKLKLLAEVRERVIGEDFKLNSFEIPVFEAEFVITSVTQQNRLRADQRISLTKLEAEL